MNDSLNNEPRWQRMKLFFNEALEMPANERAIYLSKIRLNDNSFYQELSELIKLGEKADDFLNQPVVLDFEALRNRSFIGETVSHYKIINEIGAGGMSVVYKGVRSDGEFEQTVAVKFANKALFSEEILRRFKTERQILADLEHPHIVKILDGGVTENNSPYFVMEYIEGVPLVEYCRQNELEIGERLKLFVQICDAVAYAHRNLIVHRDLKPSNILVERCGQVKLLDFGIAKTLNSELITQTMTLNAPLTPAYASPEQIQGWSISTATDIYSLGIILYELLTGKSPAEIYGTTQFDLPRAICETEPNRPSQRTAPNSCFANLAHQQRVDLDNIVLKAINKEPVNRYNSADQLADDIIAYLNGLPVKARPNSFWYRASKFYQRNQLSVSAVTILLLLTFLGGIVSIWQGYEAKKQQRLAEQRFGQVRKVANSLIFEYHDEIAKLEGSTKLREKLVVDAVNYLDAISQGEITDSALIKELAVAYRKIGDVYGAAYNSNLGKLDDSLKNYEKSVGLLEKIATQNPTDDGYKEEFIQSLQQLSIAYRLMTNVPMVEQSLTKAISVAETMADIHTIKGQERLLRLKLFKMDTITNHTKFDEYSSLIPIIDKLQQENPNNEALLRLRLIIESRTAFAAKGIGSDAEDEDDLPKVMKYYSLALEHNQKSLTHSQIYESLFPNDARNTVRKFSVHINLADNLVRLKRFDEAFVHLKLAKEAVLRLQKDSNDKEAQKNDLDIMNTEQDYLLGIGKINQGMKLIEDSISLSDKLSKIDPTNVEIVCFYTHFVQKAVKTMSKLKKPDEVDRHQKLLTTLEQRLRKEFNWKWKMKFYF